MKIHKDDTVLVIAGKDKGKKGKVRYAYPAERRVVVDGINMVKRHSKARRAVRQAGIIEMEAPINVAKVMFLCDKCNKPSRVRFRLLEDKKVRICSACNEVID